MLASCKVYSNNLPPSHSNSLLPCPVITSSLVQVREGDHSGKAHVVQMLDDFRLVGIHGTHVSMVFEVLGDNLLKLIIKTNYKGMELGLVKRITKQVSNLYLLRITSSFSRRIFITSDYTSHKNNCRAK